jgi:hypothetical protein
LDSWKEPALLDTLAASYAEAGDFTKAIEFQEKAIAADASKKYEQGFKSRLSLYKESKPYREAESK